MIPKNTLKKVIESQKEWIVSLEEGTPRTLDIKLNNSFASIISGIRRCGKSTLLNQILTKQKKFYYLNLEDPRLEGFTLKDFNIAQEIFEELYGKKGVFFFDEIQNIEGWEKYIRYLVDRKKIILITGSNASLLSQELGTRLTGRHINYELFPFSFKEFLKFFNKTPSIDIFEKFLFEGGMPEYLQDKNIVVLHELLKDVLMRDIVNRFGIKNSETLRKLAIYLLTNVGKEFSYNSLKKILEVKSVQTIIDYISFLENSYLVFTVPKFSYSYKKQLVNSKKIYSIDNGLSKANSISFTEDKGRMLENQVYLELRRKNKEIFYFQEKKECDFVIREREKVIQAVQVCYELNENNKNREFNGLIEALKEFKLDEGLIITLDQEDEFEIEGKKIIIKPAWKWMNQL